MHNSRPRPSYFNWVLDLAQFMNNSEKRCAALLGLQSRTTARSFPHELLLRGHKLQVGTEGRKAEREGKKTRINQSPFSQAAMALVLRRVAQQACTAARVTPSAARRKHFSTSPVAQDNEVPAAAAAAALLFPLRLLLGSSSSSSSSSAFTKVLAWAMY